MNMNILKRRNQMFRNQENGSSNLEKNQKSQIMKNAQTKRKENFDEIRIVKKMIN